MRIKPSSSTLIFMAGALFLALCWLTVFIVDFTAIGAPLHKENLSMWYLVFTEGGIVEMGQWTLLAAAAIAAARVGGRLGKAPGGPFWSWMAVLFVLMLMEDAGNPRHRLAHYAHLSRKYLGMFEGLPFSINLLVECLFFGALAAIGMYALFRHGWPLLTKGAPERPWLLAGIAGYAIAVPASATRYIGNWYLHAGEWVHETLFMGRLPWMERGDGHGFLIMDYLFEESLELLAAAALAAASVAAYRRLSQP